eukprot:CAMPEP_0197434680 /NCGR_PEP_ID=MMETSP1175-20131217/2379_1 /TAXON_ID=1003142 /ORGANISM="Triceratium dubium, Strain CCMP147" /LENGTH=610 /DNA_ID=CAMNT_0042963493 /DNA_START=59 /DNA_END=1891 /DNA_ORIENTATION=+
MTSVCAICRAGTILLANVRPAHHQAILDGNDGHVLSHVSALLSLTPDLTCADLQSLAADRWNAKDAACDGWRIALSDACCDNERRPGNGDVIESERRRVQEETSLAKESVSSEAVSEIEVGADGTATASATVPLYACEQSVRSFLLGDDSEYATTAVPVTSSSPLNVSTSISFYHATELSTVASTAELFFGFVLHWHDERLAWNPSDFGGCDAFSARASLDAEKTDIWVPDLDLLNRAEGMQALPDAMADVYSTGDVEWHRLGGVKAICFFDGLERFPYDELECDFIFGSPASPLHSRSASLVNYVINEDMDVLFPPERNIANYQEYTVLPERTTVRYDEEGFARIRFTFDRASRFYTSTIVVPTIIFTFVSFGMFLLDVRVGERLGFGVSLLLVIVANAILTADMLPICSERLWVKGLTTSSYYFVIAALLESIAVAYLYFLETEDLEAKKKKAEERDDGGSLSTEEEEEERKEKKKVSYCRAGSGSFGGDSSRGDNTGGGSIVIPLAQRTSMEHSCSKEKSTTLEGQGRAEEEEGEGDATGCRILFRRRMKWQGTFRRTLENILFGSPRPSRTWRMTTIRRMDRFCAFAFPVTYIVFFSVMIARNKYW